MTEAESKRPLTLKSDNRAIFAAASHSQLAVDFLHGLQATAPAQANAA
jgi:antirestriction protein ArdC